MSAAHSPGIRRLHKVTDYMHRDLFLHTIGDRTVVRPDGYQRDLLTQVAPFPDARFEIRDVQTNHAERYAGLRIAVTWVMKGAYRGVPEFGPLTGQPVDLLGVSQFLVQKGRIVREFRVYDQIALRAQINSHESSFADTNIY